jgi:dolichyl-phosphate-mannose--protein O-mannosyl transferase
VFFVLIPAVVYYLSYIPYGVAQGKTNIFSPDYARIVLDNQSYMFNYHSGVVAEHPYSSRWYQWILDIRPILYYLEYLPDGTRSSFGAFVNPALCWGGFLSLFFVGFLAIRRRDMVSGFILLGFLAQLLPWIPIPRLTFAYHYFPCTVFLCLSMGQMFNVCRLNCKNWRIQIAGFVLLSLILFVFFYPALTGMPRGVTDILRWLPTWPL